MTLSISAIAGPPASTATRTTAPTGVFALSLAQIAGARVAGHDPDPLKGDPKAKNKDEDDARQDDAADGNGLPLPTPVAPDASLLAALLPSSVPALPLQPATGSTTTSSTVSPADAVIATSATAATAALPAAGNPAPTSPTDTRDAATPASPATPPAPAPGTPPLPLPAMAAPTDPAAPPPPIDPSAAIPLPPSVPAPLPAAAAATTTPIASVPAQAPTPAPPSAIALPTPTPAPPPAIALSTPTTGGTPLAPIIAIAAPVAIAGGTIDPAPPAAAAAAATAAPPTDAPPVASPLQIDTRSAPVVALSPAMPAAPLQGTAGIVATTTSAIQAFGSAMRAGLAKDPRLEPGTDGTTGTLSTGTTARTEIPAVAATSDAQQAPLDLRRDQWPQAMVDRIEALRDSADATSTKIRVVPDALGPIEMSVRKDGDTVHVHFTADQAATRTILTDAQPRLAAIAEQRGLRLGGSTVDGGSAGAGQQQQQAAPRQPTAPLSSSPTVKATTADDDDTRIA